MKRILFSVLALVLILACGARPEPSPTININAIKTIIFNTAVAAINQTATASVPMATAAPSNTPVPTDTPVPISTPNPNLISAGTHLIGSDIQPGIYRGHTGPSLGDSCYWQRLKDVSGNLEGVLANENATGQFYVEVKQGDFAFETACPMERLETLPPPASQFPTTIEVGTYLVNIDIQPGTYQGKAGADVSASCYWERLKNVAGGLDGVLANDNSIGQYYIQVSPTDFALKTGCPLTRAGN